MAAIEANRITNAKGRNSVPKKSELFSIAKMKPAVRPANRLFVQRMTPRVVTAQPHATNSTLLNRNSISESPNACFQIQSRKK